MLMIRTALSLISFGAMLLAPGITVLISGIGFHPAFMHGRREERHRHDPFSTNHRQENTMARDCFLQRQSSY